MGTRASNVVSVCIIQKYLLGRVSSLRGRTALSSEIHINHMAPSRYCVTIIVHLDFLSEFQVSVLLSIGFQMFQK